LASFILLSLFSNCRDLKGKRASQKGECEKNQRKAIVKKDKD